MRPRTATSVLLSALLSCPEARPQRSPNSAQQNVPSVELSTFTPTLAAPIDPTKPVRVSGGITSGAIISRVQPIYPPKINCLGVSGVVVMRITIGKDGHVKTADFITGAKVMQQPSINAVRQWVYRPFQLHGTPVDVDTTITTDVQWNNKGCSGP